MNETKCIGLYVSTYLRFSDGSDGKVDLEQELEGEIFEPLRDISYFKDFAVNQELHTLVWPNSADFALHFSTNNIDRIPSFDIRHSLFDIRYSLFQSLFFD